MCVETRRKRSLSGVCISARENMEPKPILDRVSVSVAVPKTVGLEVAVGSVVGLPVASSVSRLLR
jgi:hypothetical protein